MDHTQHIAIVGGGLAGAKAAEELRARGFKGRLSIFAAEDHLPYERPPLSKEFLQSKTDFSDALVNPENWYAQRNIYVHTATEVLSIDAQAKTLATAADSAISWDKLILATGSHPRRLPLPGADARNAFYLRTVDDAREIRARFGPETNLVIIGAGWIGLEVAAAARAAGTNVSIIEGAAQPLLNVLGAEIGEVFAKLHTDHQVQLRTNAKITELVTDGAVCTGVKLADGEVIAADAVVIGIGVLPQIELAAAAGLDADNGVLVDRFLATSHPEIYAVGDIANQAHPVLGHRVRVQHWATALNQPAAVAATLTGTPTEYAQLPYFFSDQYELGMEYIGYVPRDVPTQIVVRGDLQALEFMAFWVDEQQRVRAAMNVNIWDAVEDFKKLILSGQRIDLSKLADASTPLAELL